MELHDMGLASNHGDITSWLKKFDWTMEAFRCRVQTFLSEGVEVTYIDCDEVKPMFIAIVTNPGKYINLRTGKSADYESICQIPQGASVSVLDDSDTDWWKVAYNGLTGYAARKYLTTYGDDSSEPDGSEKTPEPSDQKKTTVTVSRDRLVALKAALVPFVHDAQALLEQVEEILKEGGNGDE